MSLFKIHFDSMPWEQSNTAGVRSKTLVRAGRKLRLVEFTNEFVEKDLCRKEHIGYVLEGEIEIDFNGKVETYKPGEGVFIEGGEGSKHKAKCTGSRVKLILVEKG